MLTFPFAADPVIFVSVFIDGGTGVLWSSMNAGLQSDGRIVVVRHADCPRSSSNANASPLTPHPLKVNQSLEEDLVDDGSGRLVASGGHKFGGRPCCIQEPELAGSEQLLDDGFVHVLQLDFPGSDDGMVSGDWPFADGLFNLFMLPTAPDLLFWAFQK